ncbi:hypothetical protein BC937DRAFT_89390 [Endogone sp. FLAS-F59071]|nr:hypothetical protein BC937DRAFT_89390 [Endogone sp. FLAS-F59071]|eukprot:RUS17876.1 hypothetical protein BC937DRAFT_89390 [Endogone sp. FLAS-F59071]
MDTFWVDRDDDSLRPVCPSDALNSGIAAQITSTSQILFRSIDGVATDGDLVGTRAEILSSDLERRDELAVRIDNVANAAADSEGNKDGLGGAAEDLEHGSVDEGTVAEACDVEEGDLVGTLLKVATGKIDRLAQVADVAASRDLLADIVLIALGDNKVALVVGADVQARDHALGEAVAGGRTRIVGNNVALINNTGACEKGAEYLNSCKATFFGVELRA